MADVDTQIASLALYEIGEMELTGTEDQTKAARVAKLVLPHARKLCFDLPVNWKFASTRAQLSQHGSEPAFGYDYQYKLPDSCGRIISTVDENGDDINYRYRREIYISGPEKTPVLLCDQEECRIRYIVYLDNPGYWPGWFQELVVLTMAIKLAKPLTEQDRMKLNLQYTWKDAYSLAQASNGMEDVDVDDNNVDIDLGNKDVLDAADF
jgi:hypothetical protein